MLVANFVVVGKKRDNNITARRVTSKKWTKKPRLHYCLDTSASFFDDFFKALHSRLERLYPFESRSNVKSEIAFSISTFATYSYFRGGGSNRQTEKLSPGEK